MIAMPPVFIQSQDHDWIGEIRRIPLSFGSQEF
jgi:hypothetical protein